MPAPTIAEAVARALALGAQGRAGRGGGSALKGPEAAGRSELSLAELENALLAAKLCAYAQGFAVMAGAARSPGWTLDFGDDRHASGAAAASSGRAF